MRCQGWIVSAESELPDTWTIFSILASMGATLTKSVWFGWMATFLAISGLTCARKTRSDWKQLIVTLAFSVFSLLSAYGHQLQNGSIV